MLLTVCVPDVQLGMERMLERELEGLDAEVIKKPWKDAIKEARGEYICLLEEDSAVSLGSIRLSLQEFINNPLYRKLAMVSPMVDMPQFTVPVSFSYTANDWHSGMSVNSKPTSESFHNVRVGYVPGAIIRRSSLNKTQLPVDLPPVPFSLILSLFFWQNGLRIALQPKSLYYAPENASYEKLETVYKPLLQVDDKTLGLWNREMIP